MIQMIKKNLQQTRLYFLAMQGESVDEPGVVTGIFSVVVGTGITGVVVS